MDDIISNNLDRTWIGDMYELSHWKIHTSLNKGQLTKANGNRGQLYCSVNIVPVSV